MKAVVRALLMLTVIGALVGGLVGYSVVRKGLSTRVSPSAAEEFLALTMRYLATPQAVRTRTNPVPLTDAVRAEGLEHFADHCASCHSNDGSGSTDMGRAFYPPVPDMRASRTQALADGELFSIIEHGIRLTGMPAWGTGTADGERSSWALVHFIRHLPTLAPDELAHMEELNPRTPAEFREEEAARRFLAGDDTKPAGGPGVSHREGH